MILLLLISLTGYFLFIAKICKWPVAVTPLFTVCLIPSLLYIFGLFDMLAIGSHILFYSGLVFFTAYFIIYFVKKQNPYTDIFKPGMIVFICYFVFLYLVCQNLSYRSWDEFSHWGLITKSMFLTDGLVNSESSVYLKCYPPGMALFHYFITSIIGYSEGMVYFAQNIFLV